MKKIAVIGAGAIGGLVGARLALAGEDLTFFVRGANLSAIREHGIELVDAEGCSRSTRKVQATDDYGAHAGQFDIVILAMKAHQLEAVAAQVPKLLTPEGVLVTMQNGIPFWYFHRHGGPLAGTVIHSADPSGITSAQLPAERIIGCVVYPASELLRPGVIRHIEGDRFRSANWTARPASGCRRWRQRWPGAASRHRCWTISARRSGSSSGAT